MRTGVTTDQVATAAKVDPKTVQRWITKGRTPYPRHRHAVAALVRERESFLWPDATGHAQTGEASSSEVVKVYPHRHALPRELWDQLLRDATREIEVLVYSGLFLTEDPTMIKKLRGKAMSGTRVRILLGDPGSREVAKRSEDEGIGKGTLAAKVRNALAFFKPLTGEEGIEIRCHGTILYNSIYRFDDDMLVNTHVYGFMAAHAPVLHLRRLSVGNVFETYSESFDSVWRTAKLPKW